MFEGTFKGYLVSCPAHTAHPQDPAKSRDTLHYTPSKVALNTLKAEAYANSLGSLNLFQCLTTLVVNSI